MPKILNTNGAYDSDSNNNLNTQRASGMPEYLADDKVTPIGGNLVVTTTNIEVWANGQKIGFVQTFNPSENRTIIKVKELGTEGVVQSVPSNTLGGQVALTRLALYNSNLYNALGLTPTGKFTTRDSQNPTQKPGSASDITANSNYRTYGNPFKTLKDQRVPLEFMVKTKMPNSTSYIIETYLDCWLATYSKTIAAQTITITENATIQYSDVISSFG